MRKALEDGRSARDKLDQERDAPETAQRQLLASVSCLSVALCAVVSHEHADKLHLTPDTPPTSGAGGAGAGAGATAAVSTGTGSVASTLTLAEGIVVAAAQHPDRVRPLIGTRDKVAAARRVISAAVEKVGESPAKPDIAGALGSASSALIVTDTLRALVWCGFDAEAVVAQGVKSTTKLVTAVTALEARTSSIPSTSQPRNNKDFGRTLRMPSPRNSQTDEVELDHHVQKLVAQLIELQAKLADAEQAMEARGDPGSPTKSSPTLGAQGTPALVRKLRAAVRYAKDVVPASEIISAFFQDSNHKQAPRSPAVVLAPPWKSDKPRTLKGVGRSQSMTAARMGLSIATTTSDGTTVAPVWHYLSSHIVSQFEGSVGIVQQAMARVEECQRGLGALETLMKKAVSGQRDFVRQGLQAALTDLEDAKFEYEVAKRKAAGDPAKEAKLKQAKAVLDEASAAVALAVALDAKLATAEHASPAELLAVVSAVAEACALVPLAGNAVAVAAGKRPPDTALSARLPKTVDEAKERMQEAEQSVDALRQRLVELNRRAEEDGDDAARAAAVACAQALELAEAELVAAKQEMSEIDTTTPEGKAAFVARCARATAKIDMITATASGIRRAVAGTGEEGDKEDAPSAWGGMAPQEANAVKRFNAASNKFADLMKAAQARATSDDSRDVQSLAVQDAIVRVEASMKKAEAAREEARRVGPAVLNSPEGADVLNGFTIAVADVVMSLHSLEETLDEAKAADAAKAAAKDAKARVKLGETFAENKGRLAGRGLAGLIKGGHSSSVAALLDKPLGKQNSNMGGGKNGKAMSKAVNALVGLPTIAALIRAKNRMRYGKEFAGLVARLKVAGTTYNHLIKTLRAAQMDKLPLEVGLPLREKLKQSTTTLRIADLSIPTPAERALNPPTIDQIVKFEGQVRQAAMRVAAFERALGLSMKQLAIIAAEEAKRVEEAKRAAADNWRRLKSFKSNVSQRSRYRGNRSRERDRDRRGRDRNRSPTRSERDRDRESRSRSRDRDRDRDRGGDRDRDRGGDDDWLTRRTNQIRSRKNLIRQSSNASAASGGEWDDHGRQRNRNLRPINSFQKVVAAAAGAGGGAGAGGDALHKKRSSQSLGSDTSSSQRSPKTARSVATLWKLDDASVASGALTSRSSASSVYSEADMLCVCCGALQLSLCPLSPVVTCLCVVLRFAVPTNATAIVSVIVSESESEPAGCVEESEMMALLAKSLSACRERCGCQHTCKSGAAHVVIVSCCCRRGLVIRRKSVSKQCVAPASHSGRCRYSRPCVVVVV